MKIVSKLLKPFVDKCVFGHKWTVWSEPFHFGDFLYLRQSRTCERCHKKQQSVICDN